MKHCDRVLRALLLPALVLVITGGSVFGQAANKRQGPPADQPNQPASGLTMTISSQLPVPPNQGEAPRNDQPGIEANYTIPALSVVPTLDGVLSPGEWSDAAVFNATPIAFYPTHGIGTKVYMKVDACYLWLAAEIWDPILLAYGNGVTDNMEIWFDKNMNGQWDSPGDGVYSFPNPPAPGYNTHNGQTVAHTWPMNPTWSGTSATGYQYCNIPWYNPRPYELPTSLAQVRRSYTTSPRRSYIEAKIDYKNSTFQLTPGVYSRMAIKWYMGNSLYGANVTIMGEWPTSGYSIWWWYHYPTSPSMFHSYTPAFVPTAGDVFDVVSTDVDNSTSYAFANGATDKIPIYITGAPNPPPYTTTWNVIMKGPAPLANIYTASGTATFTANPQVQTVYFPTTGLPRGFYEMEIDVADPTVCGPSIRKDNFRVLIHNTDETPCVVWPGDMNNNGTSNLADRNALQQYIYNANTSPLWLKGPTRLLAGRVMPNSTPLDIFTWTAQPALPWATPQGCYMDADGNGNVNNLDLAGIKFNAGKTHAAMPKDGPEANLPGDFSLYQNFPNPFNPSTQIGYELPKESYVTIKIVDMLGRTVQELVNGTQAAGFRNVTFNASDMASGVYYYTMTARATDGGGNFTKTLKMTLSK